MKKHNLFLAIASIAILVSTSCSKDDENTNPEVDTEALANSQNATEDQNIASTVLDGGINIAGATKVTGLPPAPNSVLDFDISGTKSEAFQSTGFDIALSSNSTLAGAYIVFKDSEGNAAGAYFDVPASSFNRSRNNATTITNKVRTMVNRRSELMPNNVIDVDFDSSIPAGQFCYDICVYDASGNVSQIQEACITVEAWGGNTAVIGEWLELDSTFENPSLITCANGGSVSAEYSIYTKNDYVFVLNADGTYYEIYDEEYTSLDYQATYNNCEATYISEVYVDNIRYDGNWAFNEEEGTLTVIDFKYTDLLDTASSEIYGSGDVYFAGAAVEVSANQLILTEQGETTTFTRR